MKLHLQEFIEQHRDNWEEILIRKPYCIQIKRDGEALTGRRLVLFKYVLTDEPDFSIPLVKECRGIVLDEDTLEVISYPFNKFHNYGESNADEIDWNSAVVSTKIDGSIIKIVKINGELLISTNGCINAYKTEISQNQLDCPFTSYGGIVEHILGNKFKTITDFMEHIEEGYTYIFELVSPYTKIVIPYSEVDMYLIGCRNNLTFNEIFFKNCNLAEYFKTPEIHPLKSIDDCIEVCSKMPWDEEGYVVLDKYFHRIKVKSFAYLAVHRLANNGIMTYSRAIELIRMNEVDEVLAYFPEHKRMIDKVKDDISKLEFELDEKHKLMNSIAFENRKEAALWIKDHFGRYSGIGFSLYDRRVKDTSEYLVKIPVKNLCGILGYN